MAGNSEKIKELEKKIKEFGAKYSGDALTSHNEATQAALTIEVYKKQLEDLKKLQNHSNQEDRKYVLKNDIKELEITVSFSLIDPAKKIISAHSPIGKQLLELMINDKIKIGIDEFIIINIE